MLCDIVEHPPQRRKRDESFRERIVEGSLCSFRVDLAAQIEEGSGDRRAGTPEIKR